MGGLRVRNGRSFIKGSGLHRVVEGERGGERKECGRGLFEKREEIKEVFYESIIQPSVEAFLMTDN